MGFIKKALSGAAKLLSEAAQVVSKACNFLQKPLDAVLGPVKEIVGKALDKLPFGIGNFIKPFANAFLDNALSFVAGGPLGGLGVLAKAMPTVAKLGELAQTVGNVAKGFSEAFPPEGGVNLQNIFANAHAELLRSQLSA